MSITTLVPGCDDRKYNPTHALPGRKLVQSEEGALYRALWYQAIADGPELGIALLLLPVVHRHRDRAQRRNGRPVPDADTGICR